jgi:VWFA-related protein
MTLLSLAFALAAHSLHAQTPAPPARAQLWIDVTAVGSSGVPVTDLKPSEFEVWISGFRIPITDVVAVTPESGDRRVVVVILDNAAVPPSLIPRVREAARLVVNKLAPGDRMAVVSLHEGTMELTGDRSRLLSAIDKYSPRAFPFRIEDASEHVLQTITHITRQLTEVSDHRKAIVAIGAGWLFDTPLPPPGLRDLGPLWVTAMRAMASTHMTLYVIDPVGLGVAPHGYFGGESGFARETGGHAFMNTNDLQGAVERIWRETGSYYLLGVVNPPMQRTADLRELNVKVLRKGVTVRTRHEIPGRQ